MPLPITMMKSGGGPSFADAPSVALLMQHKLRCANLNGRSWRTRKQGTDRIALTYLNRRREEAAAVAGTDPPPDLEVAVDNERRQQQQQHQDLREPWLWRKRKRKRKRRKKEK
jgi:hypothetical protein